MNLKKYLKTILVKKAQSRLEIPKNPLLKYRFLTGQASLEYFIVFAVIAGLTILSASTFLHRTRTASAGLYNKAVTRILH